MHRHDLDLIAALAEGSLTDEAKARSLVASCETCRAEYDAQTSITQMLRGASRPSMTPAEKTDLHRAVLSSLATGSKTAPARVPRWSRWAYAAAGLFLVVGLAGTISRLGSFSAADSAETFSEIGSGLGGDGFVSSGGEEGAPSPSSTTAAATANGDNAGSEAPGLAKQYERAIATLREDSSSLKIAAYANSLVEERAKTCLAQAGLLEGYILIGEIADSSEFLLAIPDDTEFGPQTPITVIDFTSCDVVEVID